MIRRLIIIGGLLGLGHVTSLLAISVATKLTSPAIVGAIGVIESAYLLLISVISFGLQLATTRDIALENAWQDRYAKAQSARFGLSLLIFAFGLVGYVVSQKFIFLIFLGAPFIGLNGQYALYGHGRPIIASVLSFLVVFIPAASIMIFSVWHPDFVAASYLTALYITMLISGIFAAKALEVKYLFSPFISFWNLYLKNVLLGSSALSLVIMTSGSVVIANWFFEPKVIGMIYPGLKLYLLFRGIRRLVVQAFFKDIKSDNILFHVDMLVILMGLGFVLLTMVYPITVIGILFDSHYEQSGSMLFVFGLAALISSFIPTSGTRMLLDKRDVRYSINMISGGVVTILSCIIISWLFATPWSISLSILFGESCLFLLFSHSFGGWNFYWPRIKFCLKACGLLIVPIIFRLIWNDSLSSMVAAIIVFGSMAFLIFRQLLFKGSEDVT